MRYQDEQDLEAAADFEAQRLQDNDHQAERELQSWADAQSPDDRARAEGFTFWD